jgi:hypothetical protein
MPGWNPTDGHQPRETCELITMARVRDCHDECCGTNIIVSKANHLFVVKTTKEKQPFRCRSK